MELPSRPAGDELLPPGHLTEILRRLRRIAPRHDVSTVIAYAFDHRTRMLPFIFSDTRMAPAGVRAVGSAMVEAGFAKTRIVLQQWNNAFRPTAMRLDGRVPDLFMVSSMQIHEQRAKAMIADACRIDEAHRPLILAGGPKAVYEPWDLFTEGGPSADVAVTGEEYVLMELLEALLAERARGESMRSAFLRARDGGALDRIAGLVFARRDSRGAVGELVNTGPQRLVGNLDELPQPIHGFGLLERPSRGAGLATHALPASQVAKHSPIAPLVLTFGCRFVCHYCPIPAYNQRQHRLKSGERIAHEMKTLHETYGLQAFFGADDNFFNNPQRAQGILEVLARAEIASKPLAQKIVWGTEATVQDTARMKDHLPLARRAGLRGLWLGVEDMTATLIKKGQSVDKTVRVFHMLRAEGIFPMPMMMHHDTQPLITRGNSYGLLNQVHILRKAGAITMQVLMCSPASGSKSYEDAFSSGQMLLSAGKRTIGRHMHDGNYVIASAHANPWRKQVNILLAYLYFYNPVWLATSLLNPRSTLFPATSGAQIIGMLGLLQNVRRTLGWAWSLFRGRIVRNPSVPQSQTPVRHIGGTDGDEGTYIGSPARPGRSAFRGVDAGVAADAMRK